MKLKNLVPTIAFAGIATLFTSCLQVTQNLALNPDGSGKVVYNATLPDMGAMLGNALGGAVGDPGARVPDPEKTAHDALKGVVRGSQGIDVWEKASAKMGEDGKIHIEASAYFKDVTKVRIGSGDGPAGGLNVKLLYEKNADGNRVLEMRLGDKEGDEAPEKPKEGEPVEPGKIKAEVATQRQQWQQMKPIMAGMMADMKMEFNVKMPGEIIEVRNFTKSDADTAGMEFNGARMLETVDKMIMDDKMAEKMTGMGMLGMGSPKISEEMTDMFFGEPGGLKVVSKEGKPLFDYEAHTAKAKDGQSAELKALIGGGAE